MTSSAETAGDYRRRIRDFLASNFYFDESQSLRDDASLLDQGVIDSTGVLEVVGFIEETFGVTVEDDELLPENLDSVQGIANYISRKKL